MDVYQILIIIHVLFTLAAMVTGFISMTANPKGGRIHRKAGRWYVNAYLGAVLAAFLMLAFAFNHFFLALTLFNTYLILAGNYYGRKKGKQIKQNRGLLSLLSLTAFVYAVDVFFVLYNLEYIEYGWVIVRLSFALIAFATLFFELRAKRNRVLLHAVMMLLSYIPLVNGLLTRVAPEDWMWVCWIIGYVIFIPPMYVWLKKSKPMANLVSSTPTLPSSL